MRTATIGKRTGRALFALAFVAATLALAGASAVPSATRPMGSVSGAAAREHAEDAGIDLGRVIETVRHHVSPGKRDPATLVARERLYRAEFSEGGMALSLGRSRFALGTTKATVGGEELDLKTGGWHARLNVAERELRPGLTERVTALDGRLEWDFVLSRPPAGSGDLRLQARIEAKGAPERLRHGWRWPVARGRFVRMGALLVKDAESRTLYRAPPDAEPSELSLTIPARVLSGAAYPLVIDPVISPEYPVSDPAPGPAPGDQMTPSVAFGGTNYLVAWAEVGPDSNVYGARVSQAGAVLDAAGIAISTAANLQTWPGVAFDGTNYLVAWGIVVPARATSTAPASARQEPCSTRPESRSQRRRTIRGGRASPSTARTTLSPGRTTAARRTTSTERA